MPTLRRGNKPRRTPWEYLDASQGAGCSRKRETWRMAERPEKETMQAEIQDGWNWRYKKAVTAACAELEEMQAPTPTWPDHAAVIITKHLTPLFRELRDEAKRRSAP